MKGQTCWLIPIATPQAEDFRNSLLEIGQIAVNFEDGLFERLINGQFWVRCPQEFVY